MSEREDPFLGSRAALALAAPPPPDPTLLADVERRLAGERPPHLRRRALVAAVCAVVVVVVVGVAAVVFAGPRPPVRIAALSSARARLALLGVDDAGASRALLSGDTLQPGEGVVPGVVVVRPDPRRFLLVAAVEEESRVVTWLAPRSGCPVPGAAVKADVAVPCGTGAFSVVLVDVEGCDDVRLQQLAERLTQRTDDSAVIDVVDLGGVR